MMGLQEEEIMGILGERVMRCRSKSCLPQNEINFCVSEYKFDI
jgi:hypothetical protein